mgnify:CR=1 FL=1
MLSPFSSRVPAASPCHGRIAFGVSQRGEGARPSSRLADAYPRHRDGGGAHSRPRDSGSANSRAVGVPNPSSLAPRPPISTMSIAPLLLLPRAHPQAIRPPVREGHVHGCGKSSLSIRKAGKADGRQSRTVATVRTHHHAGIVHGISRRRILYEYEEPKKRYRPRWLQVL